MVQKSSLSFVGRRLSWAVGMAFLWPALCMSSPASTVEVMDAKVRAQPHNSRAPALAFMTLRASQDMRLVGVRTSVAKSVAFERMTRDRGELRVDASDSVELPSGVLVTLGMSPGQNHLLLQHVNTTLKPGSVVPMFAIVEEVRSGKKQSIRFTAKVELSRGHREVEDDSNH